ncbi:MAG: hypothetical protein GXP22_09835 [Gammaproteobacteria bacterium]|nr:hypothetical protein [Gammaproteobacteria bacterium]
MTYYQPSIENQEDYFAGVLPNLSTNQWNQKPQTDIPSLFAAHGHLESHNTIKVIIREHSEIQSDWNLVDTSVTSDSGFYSIAEFYNQNAGIIYETGRFLKESISNIRLELKLSMAAREVDEFAWVGAIYDIAFDSKNPKDLNELYSNINRFLREKRYGACENFFDILELERCPTLILVGMLRLTSPARGVIGNWEGAVLRSKDIITSRSLNADKILSGLLK